MHVTHQQMQSLPNSVLAEWESYAAVVRRCLDISVENHLDWFGTHQNPFRVVWETDTELAWDVFARMRVCALIVPSGLPADSPDTVTSIPLQG